MTSSLHHHQLLYPLHHHYVTITSHCYGRYGGKVTTSLSKKTSYLVIGEEAGEAKLAKVSPPIMSPLHHPFKPTHII